MEVLEPCEFLSWDTNFFDRRIARVTEHRLNPQRVKAILEWCKTHEIECLYFLADSDHAETVRLAEDYGFRLVDIYVKLQCDIKGRQSTPHNKLTEIIHVRNSRNNDISALQAIARSIYSDSRFYFDPCFPLKFCESLYETWITRSCEGYADAVLVAELNGQPVGYVSCHVTNNKCQGQIGLLGVGLQAQDNSAGKTLVDHSLDWFAEHCVEVVNVVTQGRNLEAQRLYQRCGFLTHSVKLWYHKWMPDSGLRGLP